MVSRFIIVAGIVLLAVGVIAALAAVHGSAAGAG